MKEEMPNNRVLHEIGLIKKFHDNNPNRLRCFEITNDDPLTVKICLFIKKNEYVFEIIYPKLFPYQPIIVMKKTDFRTSHSYVNGAMCLKYGIDNWNQDISTDTILNNLIDLLNTEDPLGKKHRKAPSGDMFTLGQLARWNNKYVFYASSSLFNIIKNCGKIVLYYRGQVSYSERIFFPKAIDETITGASLSFPCDSFCYIKTELSKRDILEKYSINDIYKIFNENNQSEYEKGFLIFTKDKKIIFVLKTDTDVFQVETLFSDFEGRIRTKISESTLKKKITIFGLGSIGSRVSLDLARAGFSNFVLIDDDIFLPHNIIRHELNLSHIGEFKVVALSKHAKEQINPNMQIETSTLAMTGQESSIAVDHLFSIIKDSAIIIDCTANDNLLIQISQLVEKNNIGYIAGSVFSGGFGNMIMKTDKKKKTTPVDLLRNYQAYMKEKIVKFESGDDYSSKIGEKEYVATMSDCSIIAGLIGKNAISMLSHQKTFQPPNDIYFFSTSHHPFFDNPLPYSTEPINATKRKESKKRLNNNTIRKGKVLYEAYSASSNK